MYDGGSENGGVGMSLFIFIIIVICYFVWKEGLKVYIMRKVYIMLKEELKFGFWLDMGIEKELSLIIWMVSDIINYG